VMGRAGRGRRTCVLLVVAGLLALASAPAAFGADRIYWGNGGNNTISYANLDGSGGGGQLDISGAIPNAPRGVAIDTTSGRIYWANQGNNTISYANLDNSGGGGELDISGAPVNKPHGLAIDPAAGRIYWANDNNTIAYANLDGSGGGPIDTTGATPSSPYGASIDPASGRIFWANRGTNAISYANLDNSGGGGELDISGTTPSDPHGLTIDPIGGRVYWANYFPAQNLTTISYANLDNSGGGGELNLSGATARGTVGLAVDNIAGNIYLGNLGNYTISYASLNDSGGGGVLNMTGASASEPRFMAVLRVPSSTAAPQIAGSSAPGSVLSCSPGAWAQDVVGSFFYRAPQRVVREWTRNGAVIAGATDTSYTAFAPGQYRCRETATNAAGSTSQTTPAITVSGPPDTRLTKVRMNRSHDKAKFKFKAMGEASGFHCKLKRSGKPVPIADCSSPQTYEHLEPGRYLFSVRAFGPGGTDPTPAEKRLTIP
jgi:DNA-binding beta-propeller fold protein YncE